MGIFQAHTGSWPHTGSIGCIGF